MVLSAGSILWSVSALGALTYWIVRGSWTGQEYAIRWIQQQEDLLEWQTGLEDAVLSGSTDSIPRLHCLLDIIQTGTTVRDAVDLMEYMQDVIEFNED